MNCIPYKSTVGMTDEEFTEIHNFHVGISQVGALAGLSKWQAPIAVYFEKIGHAQDNESSERMEWGKRLEEPIAQEYARRTGKTLINPEMIFQHKDLPYFMGTPDRIEVDGTGAWIAGVEIKNVSEYSKKDWENDRCPEYYEIQCRAYMHFFEIEHWTLVALLGGNRMVIREFTRDTEMEGYILTIVKGFWENHVLKRIPPALTGSEAESDFLNHMYGTPTENTVTLDRDCRELLVEYHAAAEKEKEYAQLKDKLANELKLAIGENLAARVGDKFIKLPQISVKRVDEKRLKLEHPEIYEQYSKPITYRRLFISDYKEPKED